MEPLARFSVIVPVYGGAGTLDERPMALVNQDYDRAKGESVVVNHDSTDRIGEMASRITRSAVNPV